MSAERRVAISNAFMIETVHIESFIDGLIEIHPQERAFIFDRSKQHARDVSHIARHRARESSQDLSYHLDSDTSDNTSSTSFLTSTLIRDEEFLLRWQSTGPQTSHENPVDSNPPIEDIPGLIDGMYADSEQISAIYRSSNTLPHSSDRLQVDRSEGRAVVMPHQCEDGSGTMAANLVGTVVPTALYLEPRTESGYSRAETTRKRRKRDHGWTQDLNDLYHATGSPDSFCQLKDIFATIRASKSWTLDRKSSTMAETLCVLDTLDELQQAALFFRRAYLLKLWKLREGLLENAATQNPGDIQPEVAVGKVESNVLDHLVAEAYPHIAQRPQKVGAVREWRKQYLVKRKSLQNRFQAAKNWNSLSEKFSPGILALVPSGGKFHIQNQKFETLPANTFEVLLDLLEKKEGGYVRRAADLLTPYVESILEGTDHPPPLRFESLEKETLINLDPSTLVTLCQEESPSAP